MEPNSGLMREADELVLAGRYQEAQELCERLLNAEPDNIRALCILGNAHLLRRSFPQAYDRFLMVAALAPDTFDAYVGLGLAAQNLQRPDEAVMHFRRAQEIDPASPDLQRLIAALQPQIRGVDRVGQPLLRADAPKRSAGDDRARPTPWRNEMQEALALLEQGRYREAIPLLQYVTTQKADLPEPYLQLSYALYHLRQIEAAEQWCRRGLTAAPQSAPLYNNLGMLLAEQQRLEEAIASYMQANRLDPTLVGVYSNLGIALSRAGRLDDAELVSRAGLELVSGSSPAAAMLQLNLGLILVSRNREAEAMAVWEQALAEHPDHADLAFSLSALQLKHGDFANGWLNFERRPGGAGPPEGRPRWSGESLPDKTLLVWTQYGLGDTIQFVRYLPLARSRVGHLILRHQPELGALLQSAHGHDGLVPATPDSQPTRFDHDVQISLLSLPYVFQTRLDTVPAVVPYLFAPPQKTDDWRKRLEADGPGFRVGIAWAGSKAYINDAVRSCRLADFAPLAPLPGVRLYSLQKGDGAEQMADAHPGLAVIDLAPELHDFTDTAAAILNLDLVITVDTAVAHLAGALGRPVWVLLPFHAEWRWLLEREDSPWYPTMRLFRQPHPGDWAAVITAVFEALQGAA